MAQMVAGYAGTEFVEAVRKSDGDKVTQLLRDIPPVWSTPATATANTALIIAINRRDEEWNRVLSTRTPTRILAARAATRPDQRRADRLRQAVEWLLALGAKVDGTNRMAKRR